MKLIMSSKELNEKMIASDKEIEGVKQKIENIQTELTKKVKLLQNQESYTSKKQRELLNLINGGLYKPRSGGDKIVFSMEDKIYGDYEVFGSTIHAPFVRSPRNIFNLSTTNGVLFKTNVVGYINGEISNGIIHALKKENVETKDIFFQEFKESEITIRIEVDQAVLLGNTHFNMIEIIPYLEGSFDITETRIWEMRSIGGMSHNLEKIESVTKSRIFLGEKYEMSAIEFDIKINHQNDNGLYPFGIHSLQFLNADIKTDHKIIVETSKNDYIEYIGNNIIVETPQGARETTIEEENMSVYASYRDGVLSGEIEVSINDIIHPISRNAKVLYLEMPLHSSLISLSILQLETR